jgi:hypothetical protein
LLPWSFLIASRAGLSSTYIRNRSVNLPSSTVTDDVVMTAAVGIIRALFCAGP